MTEEVEQTGVVPAPEPTNVISDTSQPPAPAPEPEPTSIPEETPDLTHELDIDGRTEVVNDEEYKYLAKLGAQSLMAAQYQQNANEQAPYEPQEEPEEEIPYDENYSPEMDQRMSNLEQQVYNQRLSGQIDNLKNDVDKWMSKSQVMSAIGELKDGKALLNEVRKEVYNKCSQEKMHPTKAFEVVSHKWSQVMGTDRSEYLLKKLRERQAAQPAGGGAPPPKPQKTFTGKEWGDGTMIQSISERLTSSES